VSDYTTDVKVQKLDKTTHDFVSGAHLQIIDKATGEVKADWWSNDSAMDISKVLNVGTTYILHEVSAP
jgi:hypothetical protein